MCATVDVVVLAGPGSLALVRREDAQGVVPGGVVLSVRLEVRLVEGWRGLARVADLVQVVGVAGLQEEPLALLVVPVIGDRVALGLQQDLFVAHGSVGVQGEQRQFCGVPGPGLLRVADELTIRPRDEVPRKDASVVSRQEFEVGFQTLLTAYRARLIVFVVGECLEFVLFGDHVGVGGDCVIPGIPVRRGPLDSRGGAGRGRSIADVLGLGVRSTGIDPEDPGVVIPVFVVLLEPDLLRVGCELGRLVGDLASLEARILFRRDGPGRDVGVRLVIEAPDDDSDLGLERDIPEARGEGEIAPIEAQSG